MWHWNYDNYTEYYFVYIVHNKTYNKTTETETETLEIINPPPTPLHHPILYIYYTTINKTT